MATGDDNAPPYLRRYHHRLSAPIDMLRRLAYYLNVRRHCCRLLFRPDGLLMIKMLSFLGNLAEYMKLKIVANEMHALLDVSNAQFDKYLKMTALVNIEAPMPSLPIKGPLLFFHTLKSPRGENTRSATRNESSERGCEILANANSTLSNVFPAFCMFMMMGILRLFGTKRTRPEILPLRQAKLERIQAVYIGMRLRRQS